MNNFNLLCGTMNLHLLHYQQLIPFCVHVFIYLKCDLKGHTTVHHLVLIQLSLQLLELPNNISTMAE